MEKNNEKREFHFVVINWESEKFNVRCREYCNSHPLIHIYIIDSNNFDQEIEKIKDIKLEMICCFPPFAKFIPTLLQKFPSIKWIHSLSAGVERFFKLENFKTNKNIIFSNSKGAYSEGFGEAAIAQMMYFSHNLPSYYEAHIKKEFTRMLFKNQMLEKKNLLIIGYGNNGVCLARRAKLGFNMKIIGVVRKLRENINGKEFVDEVYEIKNLPDEVINKADYIYSSVPLTPETVGMFNKKFFEKMNSNAVFINIGRGDSVVEDDIIWALENNIIKGASLDVTVHEPRDKNDKLNNIDPKKLLLTNHSIGNIGLYGINAFKCLIDNLENYLEKGQPINIVDKDKEY